MSLRKMMVLGAVMVFLLLGSAVSAQDLTCADIEWKSMVTDRYPNIADACIDVVEKNGKMMAKVEVEVVTPRPRDASFRFLHPDGTRSEIYRTELDADWTAVVNGRQIRRWDLQRGMKLNVYIPNDRWAVIYEDADGPDLADAIVVVYVTEPEPMAMDEPEPEPALPVTAGPLPLIGLFGAAFLALGAGLRLVRRRIR
jgi:hypothetical protein